MRLEIRSLATYLENKGTVATIHERPDRAGNYRFRLWSGPGIGVVRNDLFDTDRARNILLLEITSRDRQTLERAPEVRDFLKGKSKQTREDGYGSVDVWK